MKKEIKIK